MTYDYIAGAIELTDLNNWCSANAAFTTINATSDGVVGSCWENGPNYTRWFKFTALSNNATIQMKVAGVEGTLQHPNMSPVPLPLEDAISCGYTALLYRTVELPVLNKIP